MRKRNLGYSAFGLKNEDGQAVSLQENRESTEKIVLKVTR